MLEVVAKSEKFLVWWYSEGLEVEAKPERVLLRWCQEELEAAEVE